MLRLASMPLILLILALAAAASSLVLLLVSGWFIAASALAGLGSAALVFNYVVPAAIIRLLAVSRIASGYGLNYFGHEHMLMRLTQLRSGLFSRVMSSRNPSTRAQHMEQLEQGSQILANRSLAVWLPESAAVVMILGLVLICSLILPGQLPMLLLATGLFAGLVYVYRVRFAAATHVQHAAIQDYRQRLEHHLRAASLWSLRDGDTGIEHAQRHWLARHTAVQAQQNAAQRNLLLVSLLMVLLALVAMPPNMLGSPLVMLLPLLFLSMPEWLGAVLRAQQARMASRNVAQHLQQDLPGALQAGQAPNGDCKHDLKLQQFCWRRGERKGQPVSLRLQAGQSALVKGDSGCGKSSFLMAVAGLLPGEGLRLTRQQVHYCEQQPYILADTLRNNLAIAAPQASDETLQDALAFACLDTLADHLDEWLGAGGRLLSGGEKKRLGLARAYLSGCTVWLLDEPFEGIDRHTREQLLGHLKMRKAEHVYVLVSHRELPSWRPEVTVTLTEPQ